MFNPTWTEREILCSNMQDVGLNSAETKKNGHGGMEIINGR